MRASTSAGFSLLEAVFAMAITAVLLCTFGTVVVTGFGASERSSQSLSATDRMRMAVRWLSDELRGASRSAEDRNGNRQLDTAEDTNGNGRLDSDWSVAAAQITFNVRRADGSWSLPISYRLNDERLERVVMLAGGRTVATTVARDISGFEVSEVGNRINFVIDLREGTRQQPTQRLTVGVLLRS